MSVYFWCLVVPLVILVGLLILSDYLSNKDFDEENTVYPEENEDEL